MDNDPRMKYWWVVPITMMAIFLLGGFLIWAIAPPTEAQTHRRFVEVGRVEDLGAIYGGYVYSLIRDNETGRCVLMNRYAAVEWYC